MYATYRKLAQPMLGEELKPWATLDGRMRGVWNRIAADAIEKLAGSADEDD